MSTLLAIDTATDACSLALQCDGELRLSHELIPRRHQQVLFHRLHSLTAGRAIANLGLDAIAVGLGPGSFTGLRIAASVVQGLAFSLKLPVVGLSTLEVQVHTLLRRESLPRECLLLSTIDARIGELYAGFYHRDAAGVRSLGRAQLCEPSALRIPDALAGTALPLIVLGNGCLGDVLRHMNPLQQCPEIRPEAQDMLPLAGAALAAGDTLRATQVQPDYLQTRSTWKTLAEQGRGA